MTGVEVHVALKRFPAVGAAPPRLVYEDFALFVTPGSFVCLFGPSGIGKTTLLNMVAGLDDDFEGSITFTGGSDPRIAYAFQTPRLLPWRTVLENITLVMPPGDAARREALDLLAEIGLADAAAVYPERLSLGMQRRVALARAFAVKPDLLLMDEPFVSLDEETADRLRELLSRLLAARPATVLFVTHDSREAVRLADRIVVLQGEPARIRRDISVDLDVAARADPEAVRRFAADMQHASPVPS
jgi:NitT/TauT family transport system ATP-binding protein